ncbi:MAG: hypothetical protein EHM52_05160, partial [Actinomycetota bacterium]
MTDGEPGGRDPRRPAGAGPPGPGAPAEGPRREESLGSLLLRGASVVPFLMLGVMAVIAVLTWILVFVFGVGGAAEPIWEWVSGRSLAEVVVQLGLALLGLLAAVAVLVLSMLATSYGARRRQAAWFWPLTQFAFTGVALGLVALDYLRPGALADLGIAGRDWWLVFGWAAYAVLMAGLRMRA